MPIINRVTDDMFEFSEVMDFMVNPVNLLGVPGAGLALEFRRRVPGYVDVYKQACKTKELRIGTVQVITDTGETWGIINLPTKRHYADTSDVDDVKRGIIALRDLLKEDRYRYCSVGLPMLGCGLGKQDYEVVYPIMNEYLGDLEATIFLSMAPARTELRPKYLVVAGPLDYGRNQKETDAIAWVLEKTLEAWGTNLSEYTGVVSGGYPGVDAFIGGEHYGVNFEDTYVFKSTGKKPLVVKPNEVKNGIGANLHAGNLLCEIGDDIILMKPKGHNNNRMSAMQTWLQADAANRERNGLFPKRVGIFGDKGDAQVPDDILVPQIDDIPY